METTTAETPFLGTMTTPEYICSTELQHALSNYMYDMYGDYMLRETAYRDTIADTTIRVKTMCDMLYFTHAYTYDKLYNSTLLEYEPLKNYDMTEKENIKNSGTDTTQHDIGMSTDTENLGETRTSVISGGHKDSEIDTQKRAPFESQTYQNLEQTQRDMTVGSRTDSATTNNVSNSYTHGGKMDVDTTDHGHIVDRDLKRSGNIGVTTSQQMLQSERDVALFVLMRIVANDIIHTITTGVIL